jgi:rhodanese-related sulfurtransferase
MPADAVPIAHCATRAFCALTPRIASFLQRTAAVRRAPTGTILKHGQKILRVPGMKQLLYTLTPTTLLLGLTANRMGKLTDLLQLAQERARELGLPYAGALTPQEAYQVWQLAPGARLVDVRTRAEWDWVGRIPGAIEIEWISYPDSRPNSHFLSQLKQEVDREALVMFICRSGIRSHQAAALASSAAQRECYNVLEGFEGAVDANGQRGRIGGWRHAGLPWRN